LATVLTFIQGMLVGIANIIPGVSGGTFALILGIYERLIASIGAFGTKAVKVFFQLLARPGDAQRRQAFKSEIGRTDAVWLLVLMVGAAAAILASSRLIAYLLDEHRAPTLAFFLGLIVPSILVPYGLLKRRGWREILSCLVAAASLIALAVLLKPVTGEGTGMIFLFLSGAVAVSAMILPGISGSFVLMVMGEYRTVLEAINTWDIPRLLVFALGCLVGIIAFVRLLNFLLRRYHSVTMAFLIGLILGSLWVLWPFKQVAAGAKIVTGTNIFPRAFDAEVAWSLGALLLGLICSAGMYYLGRAFKKTTAEDE
jgi:putative membrane protein